MKTPPRNWSKDWSVEVQIRVERQGHKVLDERAAELFTALDRTESISAAARALGVSYRHAWLTIQKANAAAGQSLTEASAGGQRGGGTRLTEYGRAALGVFEQLQASLKATAAKSLPKALAGAACDSSVIHLFAAISLQEVVAQLLADYALARPTVAVRTVFGASNELAEQVRSGSTVDVFLSANCEQIDQLAAAGLIRGGSRAILAKNGLAAVATRSFRGTVQQPGDLRDSGVDGIIVADPACPLGQCTAKFLQSTGLYDELRPRLVTVDNSRAVLSAVRGNRASAGLIFSSDLFNAPSLRTLFQVPPEQFSASCEGAVIARSAAVAEASALLDFMGSTKAQACFRRCGFLTSRN